jgi:CHAD domain-containing protein
LAKKLKSDKYSQGMAAWGQFLREESARYPAEPGARLTIKQLADLRIWKVYKRVGREGDAITIHSAPEELHELRKTCKKLRYLMEFFDSLYPRGELKPLLNHLKALQEVLGSYQDYQVQEDHLRQFGIEMQANQVPANTLMAMGMLIQHLDSAKQQVRECFAEAFRSFRADENHKGFKKLFANRSV